jgi:pimeloyl-ACP methyl ester carboxylesterase
MVASTTDVVAFIVLLAGPGVPGDEILIRQLELISRAGGMEEEQMKRAAGAQRDLLNLIKQNAEPGMIGAQLRALILAQTGADSLTHEMEDDLGRQVRMVTSPWFRFFLSHDPREVLKEVRVPVLALGGEFDLQVDPKQNLPEIEAALIRGGNPDHTVRELQGLNHMFQASDSGSPDEYYSIEETLNPAALDMVSDWILTRFGQ